MSYPTNQKPGTIIVSTAQRRLYLVLGNGPALSYAIAVGKAGYAWSGINQVTDKREWPDRHLETWDNERRRRGAAPVFGNLFQPHVARVLKPAEPLESCDEASLFF